jgi:hypothetical protein
VTQVASFISEIMETRIEENLGAQIAASSAAVAASGASTVVPKSKAAADGKPEWYEPADYDLRGYFLDHYNLQWPVVVGSAVSAIAHSDQVNLTYQLRGKTFMTDVHELAAEHRAVPWL